MFRTVTSLVLIISLSTVHAKAQEYLGNDHAFFDEKTRFFQHWLNSNELGHYLTVDTFELRNNGFELGLNLLFKTTDPDIAASTWDALEDQFQGSPGIYNLAEALFVTFIRFMEVPPKQGNIQIFVPNEFGRNTPYNYCFYVSIWEENDVIQSSVEDCKSKVVRITVPVPSYSVAGATAISRNSYPARKNRLWEKILQFAQEKFEQTKPNCEKRNPKVLTPRRVTENYLEFYVNDLCREVLIHEEQSYYCDFLELWGKPCNDTRRERLEFRIEYYPNGPDNGALRIELTGKFGSGIYRPRSGAWMDMEPDFEDYLSDYVRDLEYELRTFLESQ